jgi:hypothetical protein
MAGLERLIQELQIHTPLSIPELVTGTGKAALEHVVSDRREMQDIHHISSPSGALGGLQVC